MCGENRTVCVSRGRCAPCRAKNCIFSGFVLLHVAKFRRWASKKLLRKKIATSGKMYRGEVVVHQAIHMPDLDHHLLCPMQCRANRVEINKHPRMYVSDPSEESHSVVAVDNDHEKVVIPFFLKGVTSLFNTFKVEAK